MGEIAIWAGLSGHRTFAAMPREVGAGANQGTFLDGRNGAARTPAVGLATTTPWKPFTGARWLALPIQGASVRSDLPAMPWRHRGVSLPRRAGPRNGTFRPRCELTAAPVHRHPAAAGDRCARVGRSRACSPGAKHGQSNVRFLNGNVGPRTLGLVNFGGLPGHEVEDRRSPACPVGNGMTSATRQRRPVAVVRRIGVSEGGGSAGA